uniref:Sugar phosphate phosphatase n=1 Tax=Ditylenchus dipsaci TaxID=166011 RepID=A0A915CU49_9BILA
MAGLNFIRRPYSWQGQAGQYAPVIDGTKIPSFCFTTIQERWPKIVTKLVDQLHQFQPEAVKMYGEQGDADVKLVTSKLSEMRYLMMTDKPLHDISTDAPDALVWNSELDKYRKDNGPENGGKRTLLCSKPSPPDGHRHRNCWLTEKEISIEETRVTILRILQIALWGNKCDLSLSGGDPHFISDTLFHELEELEGNILVNDLHIAVNNFILRPESQLAQLDIVMDNAGLEVKVVLHGKAYPWFVSDTTKKDMDWVLEQLASDEDQYLSKLGIRWLQFFSEGKFDSSFVIFKGDLNYRKLVGDRYWPLETPFTEALCGFGPAPLLALRTLKAETVAGLSERAIKLIGSKHSEKDLSWMVTSEYAVAQLFDPN